MSEWIKCSERLPCDGQLVILSGHFYMNPEKPRFVEPSVFESGEFHPIAYDKWGEYEPTADGDATMEGTHWMPIPEPPED